MTPFGATPAPGSLRSRVLLRVLVPMGLTWLLGSAIALAVAYASTTQAFDRSLLDDAHAIAAQVGERGGLPALGLTARELNAVLFDRSEKVFFAVLRADGALLVGDPALAGAVPGDGARGPFGYRMLGGDELRTVTLHRASPAPFTVVVAQTTGYRQQWLTRLVAYSMLPQLLLLGVLGVWLMRAVGLELVPLARLQRALEQRDSNDLTPVEADAPSSDIARLASTVNGLLRRVAHGVRAQREFAGNVAHELKTPLAGIRALADYGLTHHDPAVWQAQLRNIVASEERASRLVEQLLALAIADEAKTGPALGPVRADELVHGSLLRWLPRAEAQGVDLGAVGLEQTATVLGDAALIEGALNNLVDNAMRYGRPRDGTPPSVTVELAQAGSETRLTVSDNGPGVPLAQRESLLQRWTQGALGHELGHGTGLGLAIVTRYAELLGGRLVLDAGPQGCGLAATLVLRPAPPASGS